MPAGLHIRTKRLVGTIHVDGAKNAALPVLAATIAVSGRASLQQIPQLADVATMCRLLQSMGATISVNSTASAESLNRESDRHSSDTDRQPVGWPLEWECGDSGWGDGTLIVDSSRLHSVQASYDLVNRMRAGVCVLGPLLARYGRARVSLPGGCNIGYRPIDLHLRGLAALGAQLHIENGYIVGTASRLMGCDILLNGPSGSTVTGTCNVMTAAALARGRTVIKAAACEPEVSDVARFLNAAGARIQGAGTPVIEIDGVEELHSAAHTIIRDRIEAATLAIAAAITGGDITIEHAPVQDMLEVCQILREAGVEIKIAQNSLRVSSSGAGSLKPVKFVASPYPGVPTDTQAQMMAMLSLVPGVSVVTDRVFPDRFMHAAELVRMGADIQVSSGTAVIQGVPRLTGATVMASDLRASAALVLAALAASGRSEVRRVYHLDRGYVQFEKKLQSLGAAIQRLSDAWRS